MRPTNHAQHNPSARSAAKPGRQGLWVTGCALAAASLMIAYVLVCHDATMNAQRWQAEHATSFGSGAKPGLRQRGA